MAKNDVFLGGVLVNWIVQLTFSALKPIFNCVYPVYPD